MNPSERSSGDESSDEVRLTESRNPRTRRIDRAGPREIVDMIQAEDRTVPSAVGAEADVIARMIDDVAGRMRRGGRLVYVGAGTSGRLGVLDASECPPTFGTDPARVQGVIAGGREALIRSREGVEDDREAGRAAMLELEISADDFVLGIASSGFTPYVQAAVREAADRGAGTGFLSCTPPPAAMRKAADLLVTPLVGPEVIAGSTRMKAGTVTKLVLNTLTTGVMIRLGKVYENLMVDLRAVSRKLVDRSLRIVQEVTGADRGEARRSLVAAGGSAKTAIAMRELDTSRAVAERVLDAGGGFLRAALERFGGAEAIPYYACYPDDISEEEADALVERLRRGPGRLRSAVAEGSGGEAEERRDAGDRPPSTSGAAGDAGERRGWTVREHLAHLLEAERRVFGPRVRRTVEAGPDEVLTFEDWSPGESPGGADREPDELLDLFARERERTLRPLDDAPAEVWRRGMVIAGGEVREELRLHQMMRGVAQHDEAHATRITERIHPGLLEPIPGEG